jgi:Uma2 family endonuclease
MVEKILLPPVDESDPAEGEVIIAEGVSFEHFLKYFGEAHTEWLMGKVISVVSNNTRHQNILGFLHNLFSLFLGFKSLGKVLLAGVPMRVAADRPAREPDLIIVLNENLHRIQPTYLDGPADIVVEIVSPESSDRDRGRKLREYEAAGVREYWLLDPQRTQAVVYSLQADGYYHPMPLDADGRLCSALLSGFALHPTVLWRDEPPTGAELVELAQRLAGSPR